MTFLLEFISYAYLEKWFHNIPDEKMNNRFMLHLNTFFETVLLILYFRTFFKKPSIRWFYVGLVVSFVLFHILDLLFIESYLDFPTVPRTTECALIMLLILTFFVNLFYESSVLNLIGFPHFWMVSGFLLFFAGTFFMNIVGNLSTEEERVGFYIYDIHSYLNIFLNIIYTITLWLGSRRLVLAR